MPMIAPIPSRKKGKEMREIFARRYGNEVERAEIRKWREVVRVDP